MFRHRLRDPATIKQGRGTMTDITRRYVHLDENDRSLFLGAGYEFSIFKLFHNYIELEVNPGLTDIYRDVNESSWDFSRIKNFSAGLSLGLRIK